MVLPPARVMRIETRSVSGRPPLGADETMTCAELLWVLRSPPVAAGTPEAPALSPSKLATQEMPSRACAASSAASWSRPPAVPCVRSR